MPELGEVRRGREIGRKDGHRWRWCACEDCGKERWVPLKDGKVIYSLCLTCVSGKRIIPKESRTKLASCKGKTGESHPNWRGGKVERICLECGNTFYVVKSQIDYGWGNFCSYTCRTIYYRKQGIFNIQAPNKMEQTLIDLFAQQRLPFRYVGNGEVWLGNRNPDFINSDGKKQVIEFMGEHWHPLFDGADRIEHYKQYGFDCLIIWEDELANISKLAQKVKRIASVP